ncbi:MAG: AIR synthase family protein [Anaerolineae bacterium]|nr:AIR synthase family protein [Anaerolineae bacterium]
MTQPFPLGKLPPDMLAALLSRSPVRDPRVVIGPRPGEDAAVIDIGTQYMIAKTDPITFATDEIGWYAVHVNANDIAAMGGVPAWFMATLLFPENLTTSEMVDTIFEQINAACASLEISLVGGHSEIAHGIDRPIVVGVMLGLVDKDRLVTTAGARVGDTLIVTKGVPVEATAIIARERAERLRGKFDAAFLARCADYLHTPGISVMRDAAIATGAGRVLAMHDPTEGGLATGLWEMADASGHCLTVDPSAAVLEDGCLLCEAVGIDPLGAIASGALLMAVHPDDTSAIIDALQAEGIGAYVIGHVDDGPPAVLDAGKELQPLPRPSRDEIARLFED